MPIPVQVDLDQFGEDLRSGLQGLERNLRPIVADAEPGELPECMRGNKKRVDPRTCPDWGTLPGAEEIDLVSDLVDCRDGTIEALGFPAASAYLLVFKLAQATDEAVHTLAYVKRQGMHELLAQLVGPASPLRTEKRGLGALPAIEVEKVLLECRREAYTCWRRAAVDMNGDRGAACGVSMLDAALVLTDEDRELAKQMVQRWHRMRNPKRPVSIGNCPYHRQRKLYAPEAIFRFVEKIEGVQLCSEGKLRQRLMAKARAHRPEQ